MKELVLSSRFDRFSLFLSASPSPSYSSFRQKIVLDIRYSSQIRNDYIYRSAQILVVNVLCNQIHWFSMIACGRSDWFSYDYVEEQKCAKRSFCKRGYINCISDFCFLSYVHFVLIRLIEKYSSRASACYVIAAIISFSKREIQWNVSNFVCTVASLWYLLLANLYANILSGTIRRKPLLLYLSVR